MGDNMMKALFDNFLDNPGNEKVLKKEELFVELVQETMEAGLNLSDKLMEFQDVAMYIAFEAGFASAVELLTKRM